ncbi:A1 family peptidase [Phanerochaete sordida]|uniref:A1 family peptidase n=1 Tax=Phanerochaete sordida TaxID=48140 RepID=A0A9P3G2G2_9APHY|nr:A1 family peptidase [Phanerochaete sordida]
MRACAAAGVVVAACVCSVAAVDIPFRRLRTTPARNSRAAAVLDPGDPFAFQNLNNNVYAAEIVVQGVNFTAQLDTGSSDFWVDSSLASNNASFVNATNTGLNAQLCYLDTTCAGGPILVVDVTFGNFTISGQAMIDAVGTNATEGTGISGLIGLGAPASTSSSVIQNQGVDSQLNDSPLMNNLFTTYPDVDNYMTFLLSRAPLHNDTAGGVLTLGELSSDWTEIADTEKLPVLSPNAWATVIDGFVVNGDTVVGTSEVLPDRPPQLLSLLDTGTARALAPAEIVDALYKDLPGAEFDGCCQYTLSCDTLTNISVIVAGNMFPIHPIDAVIVPEAGEEPRADADATLCVSAFSYMAPSYVDVILGDTFHRNAYALFYFGNWTRPDDVAPYVQLLSTTDASAAAAEFGALNDARIAARKASAQQDGPLQQSSARGTSDFSTSVAWLLVPTFIGLVLLVA